MPRKQEFGTAQKNKIKVFAEDEPSSDDDDGSDIVKSWRKSLNLTHHINALTQSQTQSQGHDAEAKADDFSDDFPEVRVSQGKPLPRSKARDKTAPDLQSSDEDLPSDVSEFDWFDEDQNAEYKAFQNRKSVKRKRVAAETSRIRAVKKTQTKVSTNIIGRKPKPKNNPGINLEASSTASESEKVHVKETYLDEPTPEYIKTRKRKLKRLHEAGLRYPPYRDDLDFSDSETEEKPILHSAIKTQRKKTPIKVRETGGIVPAPIAQWLRDYQVDGVQFLHERFVRQTGALLGDDMGLGKTIQVIAFLTAAFGKTGTKRDAKLMRKIRRIDDKRWYPKVLIVCPGTLMRNWEDELEKWGWWQVYKYHGNPADRRGVLGAAKKGMLEIMITTYSTYRINEGEINTIDWDCVIADECHMIKSKNAEVTKAMNKVNALCRIGLTGTAIQNKYEELWNLLNWARPGDYGSGQEWKQMVSNPLKMGQSHDATGQQLADARSKAQELVNGILPGVFLRRMKSLIAHQLPKKSDRVVFCQLTETQADAYRNFIESERCVAIRTSKEPCECRSGKTRGWCCYQELSDGEKWGKYMFPCMITLQKLANHLALLLPVSTDNAEKQSKDLDTLQVACPDEWRDLYRIRDSILNQSQRDFCGKWKVLKRLLDFWHANGDKVLIFSHSVRLLRLLRGLFDIDGTKYNFNYLDGGMTYEDRAKVVADFNSDPEQFVFLISTKAGGVGLNITSANKVVVVDPNWNPAWDLQAQDRAYRIGQTRDVEVFRLVSSGTIEEIVYARQIYKQQQANIAYNASDERRYFKGVMDQAGQKGELFGLENLFTFQENSLLLRETIHKTNVAETRAGVKAMDIHFDDTQPSADDDDDDILSNKSLGITDDDTNLGSQIKKFAASFISSPTDVAPGETTKASGRGRKKYTKRAGVDAVNAILAKAGVQYTHENSEVIGRSEIEARLGKQAMELRNDIDMSGKRVFAASQSQNLDPNGDNDDVEYSGDDESDGNRDRSDLRVVGEGTAGLGGEFQINYRYRPDESIRRRQFCSMAEWSGYEDPVEFALVVEGMTQDDRRKLLERFYWARRKEVGKQFRMREG
ncbi:P-loop containing nucleoside triphosphate hydrolase protein [Massariosphaeria phaeospora]|uniref:P-loop containing nucleoside triphosphate hydrolase protein n=1 Tax=Massariosphaeria phaeospora TaxID=100035 RepID=A0A7C8MVJ1_9PLEO|nr:P-loop containing nucleoside triphosphate hydrolase protein [Massariosphaeria phaeospora]